MVFAILDINHPTRVFLELPDIVIDAIKEYGGRDINFCCTSCRFKGGSVVGGREQAVKQWIFFS